MTDQSRAAERVQSGDWDEWLRLFANRNEAADAYAALLLGPSGVDFTEWGGLNQAILRRWSPAGLRYIKTRAWKIAFP